ncbi:zinc finger protein 84-like [Macrosteles quadrilineatus]|uniref:zinc finger protein 84-like n=1 Tax=Macrosteles quadrilineatus TaxID=74068 RepID=UPI0023E18DB4|nr:zinc finger protein 84-like [Macrosteles quadrilineatus]
MKTSKETKKSSPKKKNFPKILLGSQKLRNKIKAKTLLAKTKLIKRRLVCEKCKERFPTWWEIREHWQSSGHKEPEECRWCRKKTYALQSHLCKEHWNFTCMCTYCGQLFMFQERLQEHEQRHTGSEYRCYCCGKRQKDQDTLRNHIFKHYVYEKYGCNICEKRFKKKINVEKHLKWIHFVCQYCGNTCENADDLRDHQKTHNDLKCVHCHKVFSQKNRLKYHYQMQHGHQDFYKCSLCFQRFPSKSRLLDHLKLKHKGYAKISCETCEMPFLYWSNYLHHFETAHAKQPDKFFCSFCDFSTNIRPKLQWHVEKTSGEGFFCKVCQLKLQCKTKFDEHMKTHEGKRDYACNYCDKSYATSDILKHHISLWHREKIVGKIRGHPCLVLGCDKYYTSRNSLSRHMRMKHTEVNYSGNVPGQFCAENTIECRLPLTFKDYARKLKESVVSIPLPNSDHADPSSTDKTTDTAVTETSSVSSSGKNTDHNVPFSSDKPTEKYGFEETAESETSSVNSSRKNTDKPTEKNGFEESPVDKATDQRDSQSDSIEVDVYFCNMCRKFWFANDKQFSKHMACHNKQIWNDECTECDEILESPEDAVRHYVQEHFKAEFLKY